MHMSRPCLISPVSRSISVIRSISSPKNSTRYAFIRIRRKNLQHIAAHPESAAVKIHIIAVILDIDQFAQHIVPVSFHARP